MDYNDLSAKVLPSSLTGVHFEILCINCSLNKEKAGAKISALALSGCRKYNHRPVDFYDWRLWTLDMYVSAFTKP